MVFELLIVLLLILSMCVIAYRSAVHEFQILQRDYEPNTNWRDLLSEQLPIVIRNIPKYWMGGWAYHTTEQKRWNVSVKENSKRLRTTWNVWLQDNRMEMPLNIQEIVKAMKLQNVSEHIIADGFSHWSWIPIYPVNPYILQKDGFRGLRKTSAEMTGIVSTDGEPIELWIAHEGAIPQNVYEKLDGKNPWEQTTKEIPWIDTVKYIEIKLRPGNAIFIPRHWWIAIRSSGKTERSWFLENEFHTPVSFVITNIRQ